MPRDPRAWLTYIVAACDLLNVFTRGKTFTDYAGDPLRWNLDPVKAAM